MANLWPRIGHTRPSWSIVGHRRISWSEIGHRGCFWAMTNSMTNYSIAVSGDKLCHHGHAPSKVATSLVALEGRLLELEHDESKVED